MRRWGIITLVLVLLTAGATLAIWYPWQNKKNNQPQTDNSQYLVIKEWGVRFKLPSGIANDVDYYLHEDTQMVGFGSRKYGQLEPLCNANRVGLKTQLIRFSIESNTKLSQDYSSRNSTWLITTINGYKYYYVPSSVGCNQNGKLNSQQSAEIGTEGIDIFDSLKTLTPM